MNNKNSGQRGKWRFQQIGLIFYCYLLIPLNELALNTLNINKIKIAKKIIDISMVSIGNAGKRFFCHLDASLTVQTGRDLIESWLRSLKSDFSQARNDMHNEKNRVSSKLACSFPCYGLMPLNELALNVLKINKIKNEKISCYIRDIRLECRNP